MIIDEMEKRLQTQLNNEGILDAVVSGSPFLSNIYIRLLPRDKRFSRKTVQKLKQVFPEDWIDKGCAHIRWENIQ